MSSTYREQPGIRSIPSRIGKLQERNSRQMFPAKSDTPPGLFRLMFLSVPCFHGGMSRDDARIAVRKRLVDMGLNQRQLAQSAGLTEDTVSDFVSGKRWPRPETMAAIENALDWPLGKIEELAFGPATVGPTGERPLMSISKAAQDGLSDAQEAELAARMEAMAWAYRREVGLE